MKASLTTRPSHESGVQSTAQPRRQGNRSPGRPLPQSVREPMERSFGHEFSSIRIHEDDMAEQVGATAFARGDHLHFRPGTFRPWNSEGRRLISHELAHVRQRREGRVRATGRVAGLPLNDQPSLEQEADRWGAAAAGGQVIDRTSSSSSAKSPAPDSGSQGGPATLANDLPVQGMFPARGAGVPIAEMERSELIRRMRNSPADRFELAQVWANANHHPSERHSEMADLLRAADRPPLAARAAVPTAGPMGPPPTAAPPPMVAAAAPSINAAQPSTGSPILADTTMDTGGDAAGAASSAGPVASHASSSAPPITSVPTQTPVEAGPSTSPASAGPSAFDRLMGAQQRRARWERFNREAGLPAEPYHRARHYGATPTQADRTHLGAGAGQVVDHVPPLVQRYYEGDPASGERPGFMMTHQQRLASAADRTRMQVTTRAESDQQGDEMAEYSKRMKMHHYPHWAQFYGHAHPDIQPKP